VTLTRLALLLAVVGLLLWLLRDDTIVHGPGVVAPEQPLQSEAGIDEPFDLRGYTINPLARFELTARVLGREDYRLGREADLSPLDLALGWGPMSDERVLEHIDISQGGRWYRWSAATLPMPSREISRHSANMHMIPIDDYIADKLDRARVGSIVRLRGQLVEVRAADGWHWRSSLSRDDTGARSCELVLVERVSFTDAR
jgi:hypothetical protein